MPPIARFAPCKIIYSGLVDVLIVTVLLRVRDLAARLLGPREALDEERVLEQVALGRGERLEQVRLEARELDLVVLLLLEHRRLLRLELGLLVLDRRAEELALEAAPRDREVDERAERRRGLVKIGSSS